MCELPEDVEQEIVRRFPVEARSAARELLLGLGNSPGPRVCRCVLWLAGGDLQKLADAVTAALVDPRDVIWWAEYDGGERLLRDLSRPFAASAKSDTDDLL